MAVPPKKLTDLPELPSSQPTDLVYIARPGAPPSKGITANNLFKNINQNTDDGSIVISGVTTPPPLSAAGQAAYYFALNQNRLMFSENGGAYRAVGDVSGPSPSPANPDAVAVLDGLSGKILRSDTLTYAGNLLSSRSFPWKVGFSPVGILFNNPNAVSPDPQINITTFGRSQPGPFLLIAPFSTQPETQSSGEDVVIQTFTIYEQTGTAGSVCLEMRRSESSLGSGQHDFIRGVKSAPVPTGKVFNINRLGHFVSGNPNLFTGRFTAASAQSPNTQSFEAADLPQSTLVYKWPASDPLPGQVLIASPPAAGVVTLSWGPPPISPGVMRSLPPITNLIGNAGLSNAILHSFTTPPMPNNGDYCRINMYGYYENNTNQKNIYLHQLGGQYIINEGSLPIIGAMQGGPYFSIAGWHISGIIVRDNNTDFITHFTVVCGAQSVSQGATTFNTPVIGSVIYSRSRRLTGIPGNIQLGVIAGADAINDVYQTLTTIEVVNF